MSRRNQFTLRQCVIVILVLGVMFAILAPAFRQAKQLDEIKTEGMSVVNALETYYKTHGEYPGELEDAITSPMTPLDQFNYEVYDANLCYELRIYVPRRNAYLRWYSGGQCWVMGGRNPY